MKLTHWIVYSGIYYSVTWIVVSTIKSWIMPFRINFEFPPTGGIVTDASFKTVRLLRYITQSDYVLMGKILIIQTINLRLYKSVNRSLVWLTIFFLVGCEMVLFILVIYFLVEEAIEVKSMGLEYFKSFWNCLDLCVIGVSWMFARDVYFSR